MLLKPCWRALLLPAMAWRAHTPPGSLGGLSVRCLGAALGGCCARALRIGLGLALGFGRAAMLRRRVLGVGGLVFAGSRATCGLTKRLVVRGTIVGRPILRAAVIRTALPWWHAA